MLCWFIATTVQECGTGKSGVRQAGAGLTYFVYLAEAEVQAESFQQEPEDQI